MRSRLRYRSLVGILLVSACAHAANPVPSTNVAVAGDSLSRATAAVEWDGVFRPTHSVPTMGAAAGPLADGFTVTGSVRLTPLGNQLTRAQITVSGPSTHNGELSWAVAAGDCRSGAMPLAPISTFPPIRLSDGRGEMDRTIELPLPKDGALHVNVYTGEGTEELNVLSCARLNVQRPKR